MAADRINDGGPAFPESAVFDGNRSEVNPAAAYGFAGGMSLRDYFATKALSGVQAEYLALAGGHQLTRNDYHNIAADAYTLADAMLKARQQ